MRSKLCQLRLLSAMVAIVVGGALVAGCSGGGNDPKYTWEAFAAGTAEGAISESVPLNAVPAFADVTLAVSEVKAMGPAGPVTLKKGAEVRNWPLGQGWFSAADAGVWEASDGAGRKTTVTVVANTLSLKQELPEAGFEFWPRGEGVAFQTSQTMVYTDRAGANLLKTMDMTWLSADDHVMLWSWEGLQAFPMAAGPDGRPPWRTAIKIEGTWWGCVVQEVVRWE